jgi:hypothetical protein
MIVPSEIQVDDIVQAMVKDHDSELEEATYGLVQMNTGNVLGVRFLSPTEKIYKSACVYELDQEMTATPYTSLCEHHPAGTTFDDLEIKCLGSPYYVFYAEVDIEDDDSEIWEDDGSDLDDFIVSDSEVVDDAPPEGHKEIDRQWDDWEPRSPGARSFKETVDMIEMRARERHSSSF